MRPTFTITRTRRVAKELWILYFNNDANGFAIANALKLAELLGAPMPAPAVAT